jgi:hypothetical protein
MCWGFNGDGELGDSTRTQSNVPVRVVGGLEFSSISAGSFHTCGVTTGGVAYCWGSNYRGQLGIGHVDDLHHVTPVRVKTSVTFVYVGAGESSSCGLTAAGDVYCWGAASGLGRASAPESCHLNGTFGCSTVPVHIQNTRAFRLLQTTRTMSCALTTGSNTYCWSQSHRLPQTISGLPRMRTITAGADENGCGISLDDVAWCFDFLNGASEVPGQP